MSAPQFSVVVPQGEPEATARTVESVRRQTLGDWELLICGGTDPTTAPGGDPRIRLLPAEAGAQPAALRELAVERALAAFVIVVEPGDRLARIALARIAEVIAAREDVDVVYTDEDLPSPADGTRQAVRKPVWSPERLRHGDYLGALCAVRTSLIRQVGGYRAEAGAALDYDLRLRVTERARVVAHVPAALCHTGNRPVHPAPDLSREAQHAAQEQLDRLGIAGTVLPGAVDGYHRITRQVDPDIRVSILLPTRGTTGEIRGKQRCFAVEAVRTALAKTDHRYIELVLIYDEPTPSEVLSEIRDVVGDRLVAVPYYKPFNYSEKINLGYLHATGDVLVLLNDDIEPITEHWLEALIAPLAEPDVGMTGARLLFADGTVQSGGHVYAAPRPRDAYRNYPGDEPGELASLMINREVSGVTGAVAALRREVFERVGGLSEDLPSNYNDVDLSLKLRHFGLRVLWLADCELFHFESQTRQRGARPFERDFLAKRWGNLPTDPYLPWLGRG